MGTHLKKNDASCSKVLRGKHMLPTCDNTPTQWEIYEWLTGEHETDARRNFRKHGKNHSFTIGHVPRHKNQWKKCIICIRISEDKKTDPYFQGPFIAVSFQGGWLTMWVGPELPSMQDPQGLGVWCNLFIAVYTAPVIITWPCHSYLAAQCKYGINATQNSNFVSKLLSTVNIVYNIFLGHHQSKKTCSNITFQQTLS